MKKVTISKKVGYSKMSNPLAKNSFRVYRTRKVEDKRFKTPRYKETYNY